MQERCGDMFILNQEHRMILKNASNELSDKILAELLISGVAFHHAGLCSSDRSLIEGTQFFWQILLTRIV